VAEHPRSRSGWLAVDLANKTANGFKQPEPDINSGFRHNQ